MRSSRRVKNPPQANSLPHKGKVRSIQDSEVSQRRLKPVPVTVEKLVVGLGRVELPTSPLSGVRSNQLSYRPKTGGAGRDRTGDLLNANQALSQLSYSP